MWLIDKQPSLEDIRCLLFGFFFSACCGMRSDLFWPCAATRSSFRQVHQLLSGSFRASLAWDRLSASAKWATRARAIGIKIHRAKECRYRHLSDHEGWARLGLKKCIAVNSGTLSAKRCFIALRYQVECWQISWMILIVKLVKRDSRHWIMRNQRWRASHLPLSICLGENYCI